VKDIEREREGERGSVRGGRERERGRAGQGEGEGDEGREGER
jgi:hypothetical protein